jgi:SAM-dependent methyltransferase
MTNSKQEPFSNYRNSNDGQIEQSLIWEELQKHINFHGNEAVLDASCGEGWLSRKLFSLSPSIFAFDISKKMIDEAKTKNSKINFSTADIEKPLPYKDNFFDFIFWNLGAHDVLNLNLVFENLNRILKSEGVFFLIIANPYYSYPVGEWKRGIKKLLPNSKPELKLKSYNQYKKNRPFSWGPGIHAYFHTLPELINPCLSLGFILTHINEIFSNQDSKQFDRKYQLYRFPMLLLLTFKKTFK